MKIWKTRLKDLQCQSSLSIFATFSASAKVFFYIAKCQIISQSIGNLTGKKLFITIASSKKNPLIP